MENCFDYHRATAHTFESVRKPHYLDWSNYPSPYKFYRGVRRFKLLPFNALTQETLDTLYRLCGEGATENLNLQELSNLAFAMNGITKVENFHGEEFGFRTTPSAGALYPFELYFFVRDIPELPNGIYHYQPYDHSLELLSEGNYFNSLQIALCSTVDTNVVAVITVIYSRSAWKYRTRAYRYCLLDAGHMAGNGVAYLSSVGLDATAVSLFRDELLNRLIGVDGKSEFALCTLMPQRPALYWGEKFNPPDVFPESLPVVRKPVVYTEIEEVHSLGNLSSCEFYRNIPASPEYFPETSSLDFGKTLFKRRSRREFTGKPITFEQFQFLVESSLLCFPADWGFPLTNFYLQVKNVEGLPDGIYTVVDGQLTQVFSGDFSREMAYLCLGQGFVAFANVNVVFTYSFEDPSCRRYRGAVMEAGALGENLYLSAESMGLGACGIGAFYDFDFKSFFNLQNKEMPLYIITVGSI